MKIKKYEYKDVVTSLFSLVMYNNNNNNNNNK